MNTPHSTFCTHAGNLRKLLILASAVFLIGSCFRNADADLKVTIEPVDSIPNDHYVDVSLSLQNESDTQIVLYGFNGKIQPAMGGLLYFTIVRNDKDTLVCRPAGPIPKYPHEKDTIILRPGQIHSEIINLTSFYASPYSDEKPQWDSTGIWGTRKWEPGKYTIQCRYEYTHRPSYKGGRNLWQGSASSNIIEIYLDN